MANKDLRVERNEGLATVTLDRPHRKNALGNTTTVELCEAFEKLAADPAVRVIVITGAGDAFCAGGDYRDTFQAEFEKSAQQWRERIRRGPNRLVTLLSNCEKPVIACVNGDAVGGGATIALACDIRIASDRARFGFVFSKVGVTPEFGCTWLLPRVVGASRAMELLLTGDLVDAQEAARMGLVSRVVPHADVHAEAEALARRLIERPAAAMGVMKTMVYRGLSMDLAAVLEMEALALSAAMKTEEHQAVVKAFLSRRGST